jgi:TolB-like protein/Tfp pilus assembly protein PilF
MAAKIKKEIRLEIAHVLFIDIVGYSKLSINEQRAAIDELTGAVRASEQFQNAEAAARLIKIPTGDGMALVFYKSPEEPVECALEISRAPKEQPKIQLRMGVHSGPVSGVIDVNGQPNLAGAGLNMAQRVMDCGDAGHILLSKRVADDLGEYEHWRPLLHDLGECEVKHGVRIGIVNFFGDQLGNPALPQKIGMRRQEERIASQVAEKRSRRKRRLLAVTFIMAVTAVIVVSIIAYRMSRQLSQEQLGKKAASVIPEKSVAVLPFENLSDEKQNAYFADGVQDEILTDLAKIAALKVISRSSVMQYKSGAARNLREIGQQLGVAHLLEGSVQRAVGKIRVNAQLIDARTDAHEWAENYDRPLDDVFAIQSEIAKAIADQLQAKLSPNEKAAIEKPPTTDVPAFDLFSRARTLLLSVGYSSTDAETLRQAAELLDQAVARDPNFFDAYCSLVIAHGKAYALNVDHTPARLASAEAALQAAARLRPDAAETHLFRAQLLYYGYRDYADALAELRLAGPNLPNDSRMFELTGYILRRRGEMEEGLRNLQKAVELDPRNYFLLQQLALSNQLLRRYPEEIALLDRSLTIKAKDVATRALRASVDFYWKADTGPLHRTIDSILAEDPGEISHAADTWFLCAMAEHDPAAAQRALDALGGSPAFGEAGTYMSRSFGEGLLARMTKDEGKARASFTTARAEQEKLVQAQPGSGPVLCVLGMIDAALGNKEAALAEGRRAITLVPVANDSVTGSQMIQLFAINAAWTGDKELAFEQLELAVHAPAAAIVVTYGGLKLLPFWDPLRGDPRFEKIVASLAPK